MQCPSCEQEIENSQQCSCGWSVEQTAQVSQPVDSQSEQSESGQSSVPEEDSSPASYSAPDAQEPLDPDNAGPLFRDKYEVKQEFDGARIEGGVTAIRSIDSVGVLNAILNVGEVTSKRSLIADTYNLPAEYDPLPEFIQEQPKAYSARLKESHLLAISCEDPTIALSAAQILIQDLNVTDLEYRRWYRVRDKIEEDVQISVRSFIPEGRNEASAVVVIDAFGDSGQAFVSSLIGDLPSNHWLKENKIYLLLLVSPSFTVDTLESVSRSLKVTHWKISCLLSLLRWKFPDDYDQYEQEIARQQTEGKWYPDPIKLYNDVKSQIEKDRLPDEIKLRDKAQLPKAVNIFIDDQHIEKTLFYVAIYFPDIAVSEFAELVEALLGGREVLGTIPQFAFDNYKATWSQSPKEQSLVDIWNENRDRFIRNKLFRETISNGDTLKSIDFADYRMRSCLRDYLESERKFFLREQFDVLQRKGFLFHPSSRVGERAVQLAAEMALTAPDDYDREWLVEIVKKLRDTFQPRGSAKPQGELRFLSVNQASRGYSRISELVRELLKAPQTRDLVNRCLSELMKIGYHDFVLVLIRRLRPVQDFDRLHWLKQLFDRGDPNTKAQAFNHLYESVRDSSIYETLRKLEGWFPSDDRDINKYPQSALFVLRLLIKYCFETIYEFNQKSQGSGAANYVLFSFSDEEVAKTNIEVLVWRLLHPSIIKAFGDTEADSRMKAALNSLGLEKSPLRLLGGLMAEWAVILAGLGDTSSSETGHEIREMPFLSAAKVLRLLVERVSANTSLVQQRELITFWEESNRELLRSMTNPRRSREDRNRLAVRWDRIFALTKEFRKMHRAAAAS